MVKRLNILGKLVHLFTATFPLFLYWSFVFFTKIQTWSTLTMNHVMFFMMAILSIGSILTFYKIINRKRKNPDREFKIISSSKHSNYFKYAIGSLFPFILFIGEFFKNGKALEVEILIATIIFLIILIILIFKDDKGILYNLFYLPYHFLEIKTKNATYILISKKESLTNYVKSVQLDKMVFKEWN
jgi:hypothetical protein